MSEYIDVKLYWNPYEKLLSHTDYDIFISTGGRGIGKTFGMLKVMVKDFLETGAQFVYLRRRQKKGMNDKTNLQPFIKIFEMYFEGHTVDIKKGIIYIDEQEAGFVLYLKEASGGKSMDAYNVINFFMDEFQRDDFDKHLDRYYNDEYSMFVNLFETVTRGRRDQERKPRIILLSNAKSRANPYFEGLGIFPNENTVQTFKIKTPYRTIKIVLEQIDGTVFKQAKLATLSGALLWTCDDKGSGIDNCYIDDNLAYIAKRNRKEQMKFVCNLVYSDSFKFSVWEDKTGKMWVDRDFNATAYETYTPYPKAIKDGVLYIKTGKTHPIIWKIWYKYVTEGLNFYDLKTKNKTLEMLGKWGLLSQ